EKELKMNQSRRKTQSNTRLLRFLFLGFLPLANHLNNKTSPLLTSFFNEEWLIFKLFVFVHESSKGFNKYF
ncbi:MAG: hypothetical protein KDI92_08455, partial [Xanthomonadales bacterium]|nr:hypothetical protein [Xanthomonadales bacterium]